MKRLLAFLLVVACGAAAAAPLGDDGARRLLTRAGFAPSPAEVAAFAPLTQPQAVDRLLHEARTAAVTPPPAWIDEAVVSPRALRALSDDERKVEREKAVRQSLELRGWWITEMVTTPSPLTERMTLFWHNHFVAAQPKVRWPQLMYRQNVLLRRYALGDFRALLHAVARDPALLVYLDAASNRRGNPNENLAREMMELFVLGQGRYSEADVKEVARAFTGLSLDPNTLAFQYRPGVHDDGTKTVLGVTGPLDADAALDAMLAQPAAAEFIVRKLWLEFVSPVPDEARVARIAARLRASGWRIDVAVRELLLQPDVVAGREDQALVKSPVELAVGLVRQNGGTIVNPIGAAAALAAMGQNLYSPPNVRGWPGGEAWINTQTLLVRKQSIERALLRPEVAAREAAAMAAGSGTAAAPDMAAAGDVPAADRFRRRLEAAQLAAARIDPAPVLKSAGLAAERPLSGADIERLADRLLVATPLALPPAGTLGYDALRALLLDPAYQLK